jgi:hypothetical protein
VEEKEMQVGGREDEGGNKGEGKGERKNKT